MSRNILVMVAAVIVVSLAGCASGSSNGSAAPGSVNITGSGGAGSSTQAVRAFAQARFPANFSGVVISRDHKTITVYRRPGSSLDAAVRAQFPQLSLNFAGAPYDAAHLAQVAQQVSADMPFWREHGIVISTVGPADDGSGVDIGTPDVASAQTPLINRYGSIVRVHSQAVPEMQPYSGVLPTPSR